MYKSYKRNCKNKVRKLEKSVERCKNKNRRRKLERDLYRLRKREPSLPTVNGKIPVMFDCRIGSIEFSNSAKEFHLWCRISTIDIPLHSYSYAERLHCGYRDDRDVNAAKNIIRG